MGWEAITKHQDSQAGLVSGATKRVEEWQRSVHELIMQIEAFVKPLRDDKRILCHRDTVQVSEEGLGNYRIEKLNLDFRQVVGTVGVIPKSPLVIGVRLPSGVWKTGFSGRVNLSYGANVVPMTRKDNKWWIGLDNEIELLDATRFEAAISRLLDLE